MSWRRGGGEWREEERDDRTGAERGKRLWEDVIMSRINSKTGGERQRLARERRDTVHRFSARNGCRWGDEGAGMGHPAESRGMTVLIKDVFG